MRSRRLALIALALLAAIVTTAAANSPANNAASPMTTRVVILGAEADLPVVDDFVRPVDLPPAVPIPADFSIPPSYAGVIAALHQMTPEQLIRFLWPASAADRMVAIARRESGLRCDADNPRSSAAGLFQTIGIHRARAARMNLSWADITGPDCVADAFLAKAIWDDSGFAPWRM